MTGVVKVFSGGEACQRTKHPWDPHAQRPRRPATGCSEGAQAACGNEDGEPFDAVKFGWVSEEQRQKAIATDSVWELHWYPDTPIGFIRLLACDLTALVLAAQEGKGSK